MSIKSLLIFLVFVLWCPPVWAFRTTADLEEFGGQRVRWKENTVQYQLHKDGAPGITLNDIQAAIEDAANTWSSVQCAPISMQFDGLTAAAAAAGDGANTIEWVDDWQRRGWSSDAAGTTDVQYERDAAGYWHIVEADIYLNAQNQAWAIGETVEGARNATSVLTHEIGHLLGMLHPCELSGAEGAPICESRPDLVGTSMYPKYSPTQSKLADDDVAGICALYAAHGCQTSGCPMGLICTQSGCVHQCGNNICESGQVCVGDGCASPGERECRTNKDCQGRKVCHQGLCQLPLQEVGDFCSNSAACAPGVCSEAGFCAPPCVDDTDCASGSVCSEGTCGATKLPMGAACVSPDDCIGGECLAGLSAGAQCTRSCATEHASCPGGWQCGPINGRLVCQPPIVEVASSCSLAHVGRETNSSLWPLAGAILVLGAFLRRFIRRVI